MKKYRGNTFIFPFSFEDSYTKFEPGDIIKFGVKQYIGSDNYILYKEIVIEEITEEIQIRFEEEETKKLEEGKYIMELKLTKNGITETAYREELVISEVVVE